MPTLYESAKDTIALYISSSTTFINLSTGALILTVTFREKVLGQEGPLEPGLIIISSWIMFLLAIGTGAFYQYLAVKKLESISGFESPSWVHKRLRNNPGYFYGAMLLSFFAGVILFVWVILASL